MCDQERPPGATSSMQLPGFLAMSELCQDRTERGETLLGGICLDSGIR